jgi:hypothetical protein
MTGGLTVLLGRNTTGVGRLATKAPRGPRPNVGVIEAAFAGALRN